MACAPADILADGLRQAGVHLSVAYPRDPIDRVFGITRGDATGITIGRPQRSESPAALSEVWAEADGVPLRAFLAVVTGPPPTAADPMQVQVTLEDGRELTSAMPPKP